MHKLSDANSSASFRPLPALKDIERALGYSEYPTRSRTVDLSREEHPYYASLGVIDNFTDEHLIWGYDRQCDSDKVNKPYYLDCLEDIATGRDSSDLQTKVVIATSAGEYSLKAIKSAYKFFGLQSDTNEGDDHIIGLYKSFIESSPKQKQKAKSTLKALAIIRNSKTLERAANEMTMTYEEALELLDVTADTDADMIPSVAVSLVSILHFYLAFGVSQRSDLISG